MGLFGNSGGDTAGGDPYASKMRSSSSQDLDLSFDPAASSSSSFGGSGGASHGDLETRIQIEQQKAQLMSQIHRVNDACWDMCIDSMGSSLSGRNQTCLSNCAERFVDTTLFITNRFAQLAQKMQR